jgi:hypothetical protein
MKNQITFTAVFCLLAPLIIAQTAAAPTVPVAQEPHHHASVENEYVRVFKLELAPKEATLMHRHDADYIGLMLGDATFTNDRQGSKPAVVQWKNGEVRFTKGGFSHSIRNEKESALRNVTVELLRAGDGDEIKPAENAATPLTPKYTVAGLARKGFSTFDTTLPAGATVEVPASTGPALVVAVTDADLRAEAQGQEHAVSLKSGDALWVTDVPSHSLTNNGSQPARWVVIQFKN